jgi:hypothetical protein
MVSFNSIDYNVDKIEKLAKLNKFKTDYDYRIYGLRDDDKNPLILIEFNIDAFEGEITDFHKDTLAKFFSINGIDLRFHNLEKEQEKKFWIGLHYDLRKDCIISANAIQTIVYFLQGKLNLDAYCVVPGIPQLYKRNKKYKNNS